jgi:integrase
MIGIDIASPGRHSTDIPGLYLHVTPRRHRRWVFRYSRPHGAGVTEHSLGPATLANFPAVQLKVVQLRALLAQGTDPVTHNRSQQRVNITFAEACSRYLDHNRGVWSASQQRNAHLLLRVHGRDLATTPVPAITEEMVYLALKPLWEGTPKQKGTPKQARRALNMWKCVLDFAGRRGADNPATWKGNMQYKFRRSPREARNHYAAMPVHQVPLFVAVLQPEQVRSTGAVALEFCILTATRSSETLNAEWSEFDLENRVWVIPAERMKKTKREHRVPLSNRVMELLKRQLNYRVNNNPFVFTGYLKTKPLAAKSMVPYLRDMGATETVHGFRASFKTWATEQTQHPREIIELCLAHQFGNQVEQAYLRGDALDKRRVLMDEWEQFCLSGIYPDD